MKNGFLIVAMLGSLLLTASGTTAENNSRPDSFSAAVPVKSYEKAIGDIGTR